MNEWKCDETGCTRKVQGVGGGVGLRAIGWWFQRGFGGRGPTILCPEHRPDGIPCEDDYAAEDAERTGTGAEFLACCPFCAAEKDAKHWQDIMNRETYGEEP